MADKGRPVQRYPNLLLDNDKRDISLASNSISGAVSGQIAAHVAKADPHTQYLLANGTRELTGNLAVSDTKTIDGRDLSIDGTKLDGIEAGAEVNNISDADATDLTDGGETTLHTHAFAAQDYIYDGGSAVDFTEGYIIEDFGGA